MIESIIRTAVQRASQESNAEAYLVRLRQYIESDIRHQIKLHGGRQSFDVNTRFHLGYSDADGFYQEITTNVVCAGNGKEMVEHVRFPVSPNSLLGSLRGVFHHAAIKAKQASDTYFTGGQVLTTQTALQNELQPFFANHKAIVVLNHARTGNYAVDVELIQSSMKNLGAMMQALEHNLPDDLVTA
ncbi:hypothetical protein pEaSNUABM37_00134 [Erwinia phage pEa_SNUABM_37]|nr:hypothetical protein pEaSNUABM37_00134 [Erwinia phage pEa_SNUABM_37]QXO10604.1 hypothetical protein pEaSNUABM48_00134 [Erwinia phage pEa_SNUABM_48]